MSANNGSSPFSWPPPLFLLCLLAAGIATAFSPQPFIPSSWSMIGSVLGLALIVLALWIGIQAQLLFRRAGTPVDPRQPVTTFVADGVYNYSRNPMYLTAVLILLGTASIFNSLWLLLSTAAFFALVWILAIRREERYLAAHFGEVYQAYRQRVPRWIGPF